MRYLVGLVLALALGVMGCNETSDTGGDGGVGGDGGAAGIGGGGVGGEGGWAEKYDFSAVDAAANEFIDVWPGVRGITLAVVQRNDGQIYEKGYGEFERDRISLIASTSKVPAASVILTLVDDGLLELDRAIAEYLDWGEHHPAVTIEHLLSMMSGIEGWPENNHRCVHNPATTVQECGRIVFQDESGSIPPEEEFRYSGSAWQLAGAVAEVVSGKSWAELVDERLSLPCGLVNTGFISTDSQLEYPASVDGDPANSPPSDNPEIGGGAYTTVNDYGKVLLMHLREGYCGEEAVLSIEMVRRMQEELVPPGVALPPWTPPVAAVNYGMGWFRYEDDPELLVDPGAWGAKAMVHPDEGWGAVFIMETTFASGNFLHDEIVPLIRSAVLGAKEE